MLTFTHTYLLNRACQQVWGKNLDHSNNALILGNLIPDFITHLGRDDYQALAHNLTPLLSGPEKSALAWGAIFHIFCDNFSTLGRIDFDGRYHDLPRAGFIETRAHQVQLSLDLNVPRRRILQCVLDVLVLRAARPLLVDVLVDAAIYLQQHIKDVSDQVEAIYQIHHPLLASSLLRFSQVYGPEFIENAATEEFRIFPLVRSLLNLNSMTAPETIWEKIQQQPELQHLIEINLPLLHHDWMQILDQTVTAVLTFPGLQSALRSGNFRVGQNIKGI